MMATQCTLMLKRSAICAVCAPFRQHAEPGKEVIRRMKLAYTLAAIGLAASAVIAAPTSGLPVGKGTTPFDVVDVSGPNKGKQLCYR